MANTPKKITDPTEAALSAIQDALTARDTPVEAEPVNPSLPPLPPVTSTEEAPSAEEPWRTVRSTSSVREDLFETDEVSLADEPGALRRPANDDRESIGQILRTLQRRPSRTSYVFASVFAGLWVLAGLVLGWLYLPQLQASFGPSGLTAPVLAVLAAAFFVPIVFFYVLAHMAWRSQELRLITQSMAEVAMRLAEPETVARESIVTVGQAIRREVAAMGDGIERALARAAELETLSRTRSPPSNTRTTTTRCASGRCCRIWAANAIRSSARPGRSATPSMASTSISATTFPRSASS